MYTLAGLANDETGWGVREETWSTSAMLERYGAETWFGLGDRDMATHVRRTQLRREGLEPDAGHGPAGGAAGRARAPAAHDRRRGAHGDPHTRRLARVPGVLRQAWPSGRGARDPAPGHRRGPAHRGGPGGGRGGAADRDRALEPVRLGRHHPGRAGHARGPAAGRGAGGGGEPGGGWGGAARAGGQDAALAGRDGLRGRRGGPLPRDLSGPRRHASCSTSRTLPRYRPSRRRVPTSSCCPRSCARTTTARRWQRPSCACICRPDAGRYPTTIVSS